MAPMPTAATASIAFAGSWPSQLMISPSTMAPAVSAILRSIQPRVKYTIPTTLYGLASHKASFMFLPNQNRELPDHFLALANPTRLRLLERLAKVGEESVNDLAAHLRLRQPRISWHLRMLRVGGVIRTRRDGRQVYCSLDVENLAHERDRLDELLGITDRMKVREEVGA